MIKCTEAYESDCKGGNMCCCVCPEVQNCNEACNLTDNRTCGCSYEESNALQVFDSRAARVIQNIADLSHQKDLIEEQDKWMRQELEKMMEQYGIKNFNNDLISITYVEPTTSTKLDSKAVKTKYPEVFNECSKTSEVKGYVRIKVK